MILLNILHFCLNVMYIILSSHLIWFDIIYFPHTVIRNNNVIKEKQKQNAQYTDTKIRVIRIRSWRPSVLVQPQSHMGLIKVCTCTPRAPPNSKFKNKTIKSSTLWMIIRLPGDKRWSLQMSLFIQDFCGLVLFFLFLYFCFNLNILFLLF